MSSRLEPASMIARLQSVGDDEFEHFVAEIFEDAGWDTEVTQSNKDGGIDVIAKKGGVIKQRANIQAKRYSEGNKVDQPEVSSYEQLKNERRWGDVDHAVVVTTSSFTKGGFEIAKDLNIKLLDGMGVATLVQNRGLKSLIEEYTPEVDVEGGIDLEEYRREPRDEYYGDFKPEHMSSVFSDVDLIHSIEVMENRRIGKHRITALDEFRRYIHELGDSPPRELLVSEPWLLDLNWWDVEVADGMEEKLVSNHSVGIREDATDEEEIICLKENGSLVVVSLIPPREEICRPELERLESHVDGILTDSDNDIKRNDEVSGYLVGGSISNGEPTTQKLSRLGLTNFRVDTYPRILEKAIKANRELIQAVRPFAVQAEDQDTVNSIRELNEIIESTADDKEGIQNE